MAKPRKGTEKTITVKGKVFTFYGYAPSLFLAASKAGKNLDNAQFINTG